MLFRYDQLKSNLGFAQPILLNFFLQNENIKLISKLVNLKKKKEKKISYTCNVYKMFYYETQWFYKNFKSENLWFLNLCSIRAVRILNLSLEIMLSAPKWGAKYLYNYKDFSFIPEQV